MDTAVKIIKEIEVLNEASVKLDPRALLNNNVRESLIRLSRYIQSLKAINEKLLFLLARALADRVLTSDHITYQSLLYLLSNHYHYHYSLSEATFANLKVFCQYIKLRYGSKCLDGIRNYKSSTITSILQALGLYSSQSIIRWEQSDTWHLRYLRKEKRQQRKVMCGVL